jgi:23S rRNA (uracil1939-C5)-methyltransferase
VSDAADEAFAVEVTSLGARGEGVARHEGLVVFVPGALPGDRARVRVVERRDRFARARLVAVERPSPDRRQPPCAVAERCGGCPLMALTPAAQRRLKRERLVEVLRRLGGVDAIPVEAVLTAGAGGAQATDGAALAQDDAGSLGYRAKAAMPVAAGPDGQPIVGFYGRASHDLVEASACPVTHPAVRRVVVAVRDAIADVGLEPYDERTATGFVRHIVARVGVGTGQGLAVVVTRTPDHPRLGALAASVAERLDDLACLAQSVQPEASNRILGRGPARILAGNDAIEERVGPLTLRLSPTAFFQVNPRAAEAMYARTVAELALGGGETVVDAHSGVGAIGLWAAAAGAGRVIGFETVAAAVDDARANARLNGLSAEFAVGAAETLYPRWFRHGRGPDAVILDPPRAGIAPALVEALRARPPQRLVYVSCAPETLARDLGRLVANGRFAVERVVPVDLFPQTAHLEAIAVLHSA